MTGSTTMTATSTSIAFRERYENFNQLRGKAFKHSGDYHPTYETFNPTFACFIDGVRIVQIQEFKDDDLIFIILENGEQQLTFSHERIAGFDIRV